MKFDDLFGDDRSPATKAGNERLEAQKRKLIADCSFWHAYRNKAALEALCAAGTSPIPTDHLPEPKREPAPPAEGVSVGARVLFRGRGVDVLALAEEAGFALVRDGRSVLAVHTRKLKPKPSKKERARRAGDSTGQQRAGSPEQSVNQATEGRQHTC